MLATTSDIWAPAVTYPSTLMPLTTGRGIIGVPITPVVPQKEQTYPI